MPILLLYDLVIASLNSIKNAGKMRPRLRFAPSILLLLKEQADVSSRTRSEKTCNEHGEFTEQMMLKGIIFKIQ